MITIPTTTSFPDYVQTITLGATTYRLRFTFNGRDASWYMTILGAGGDVLVAGIRVRIEYPITRQYVGAELPAGIVVPVDLEGMKREPGRDDLREEKVPLVFVPTDEIDDVVDAAA